MSDTTDIVLNTLGQKGFNWVSLVGSISSILSICAAIFAYINKRQAKSLRDEIFDEKEKIKGAIKHSDTQEVYLGLSTSLQKFSSLRRGSNGPAAVGELKRSLSLALAKLDPHSQREEISSLTNAQIQVGRFESGIPEAERAECRDQILSLIQGALQRLNVTKNTIGGHLA